MLAPISEGRRDSQTSFKKLKNFFTREKDPETGEEIAHGEVILSGNLLSLETADLEMMGTAGENRRNQDPVYHFQWRGNQASVHHVRSGSRLRRQRSRNSV